MKIFDNDNTPGSWGSKINFADRNNVLVGYDMGQSCCEHAGWYISREKRTDTDDSNTILADTLLEFDFDPSYFEEVESPSLDYGGMVRFRLVHQQDPLNELWLHLFNAHNGYYGHGFQVEHSGTTIREGTL